MYADTIYEIREIAVATTAIIMEILVIGYTSLLWIVPLLMCILGLSVSDVLPQAREYKDWAPVVALVLTALTYQIGWLLDYCSYVFFYYVTGGRKIKRKYVGDGEFWAVYTAVYQNASQPFLATLQTDLNVIRFSRTGAVNFLAIGVVSVLCFRSWILALLCVAVAAASIYLLWKRWDIYYRKIKASWEQLKHA